MRRLKAFTLMELVVVMFIGGLVFSLALRTYGWFQGMLFHYKEDQALLSDVKKWEFLMYRDVQHSTLMMAKGDGIEFQNDTLTISYQWLDSTVVRLSDGIVDSFSVKVSDWEYHGLQEGKNVSEGDVLKSISLGTVLVGDEMKYAFFKEYGADLLMQIEKK